MEHSEPFENEKMMSDEDHLKLVKIGKWMVGSMVSIGISLVGIVVYI